MEIKDYIKNIEKEIEMASNYMCAGKSYKNKGNNEHSQYLLKLANDSIQHIDILFKMLDKCIEEEVNKEGNNNVYKKVYETCIDIMKDKYKDIEAKIKT